MINIYLCEDDRQQLEYWSEIIHDYLQMHHLNERLYCAVQSPDELLERLEPQPNTIGLYFLDICLNADQNGLQLASKIRKCDPLGEIVFITSRSEMCYLTYEYQVRALDFILKDNPDILPAKIRKCICAASEKEIQLNRLTSEPFYLKIEGERVYLNPDDILYIQTAKDSVHKITIYTTTRMENIYGTLKEMVTALEKYSFFCRCHKSIIVNKKHIKRINSKTREILLDTEITLPVSGRYLSNLQNK